MELSVMLDEIDACTRAARACGVPDQDLDDIAQKGRLAAARAVRREGLDLSTPAKRRAYMAGVGRRQARNYRRARRRIPECRDPREIAQIVEGIHMAPSAEDLVLARTPSRAALDVALAQLAATRPELHAVVEAHDLEGRDMAEIARELGIPRNTAWNWRRLAWNELRALVTREQAREQGARR
jgi:DNA-directed RNA polymerase specialized sigma24 family protein